MLKDLLENVSLLENIYKMSIAVLLLCSVFSGRLLKKIKRERLECHLYGQLIAILLCSSTMFQMRRLLFASFPIDTKHTKISSADQGIGSHYYFLYSRSEERVVGALGF